ncbi:MAG: ATP-binding cassette domain-containing protein [Planctomycetes bacterium]|nr:ATP-binding cassette domain-containing protein [Planctomycetota bacterium]
MIAVENLDFRYGQSDFRLRVPELVIDEGAKVALVGPSGSGKTTLLNLMAGITLPLAGRVVTHEVEVSSLGDAARRDFRIRHIGLVFQEFELLDHLTVLDNILLAFRINAALELNRLVRERAARLAQEVGIGDKLHRYVRRLSQGERQRVAVCRALLPEPPLLLCDEPTGNLDPANKQHVLDILVAYVEKTGATMVAVTHDHEILPRFDTVIDFGQFHADGGEQA